MKRIQCLNVQFDALTDCHCTTTVQSKDAGEVGLCKRHGLQGPELSQEIHHDWQKTSAIGSHLDSQEKGFLDRAESNSIPHSRFISRARPGVT